MSAALAQLVEQFIRNEKVASSIPASGTKSFKEIPKGNLLRRYWLLGSRFLKQGVQFLDELFRFLAQQNKLHSPVFLARFQIEKPTSHKIRENLMKGSLRGNGMHGNNFLNAVWVLGPLFDNFF